MPIITCKLSLVGMQLPEKYKENFDVSQEGLRSKRRNSPYIFQVFASLPTKACSYTTILPINVNYFLYSKFAELVPLKTRIVATSFFNNLPPQGPPQGGFIFISFEFYSVVHNVYISVCFQKDEG